MASSSVSQDDVDIDFEISSRRSRIRTARARNINPPPPPPTAFENDGGHGSDKESTSLGLHSSHQEHDASPKPTSRIKEKRINRLNHGNKGKQQRDRRKLREKRRSTGVVQLHSTESTGGSTGEDEELLSMTAETRRNTHFNEHVDKKDKECCSVPVEPKTFKKPLFTSRCKSPSDLEADDEDNQDYDSLTMSDSTLSLVQLACPVGNSTSVPTTVASSVCNGANQNESMDKMREENERLTTAVKEKDARISSLEDRLEKLSSEVQRLNGEKRLLAEENASLIRAMAALKTK